MNTQRIAVAVLTLAAVVGGLGAQEGLTAEAEPVVVLAPGTFLDDTGSVHETNIEALAAAGITHGCNPPDNNRYCPTTPTSRAEMATFLARGLNLPATTVDYFTDDTGSIHEPNINALAAAGITHGCNPPDNTNYCPTAETTREQMASFLSRALNLDRPVIWPLVHDAEPNPIEGSSYAWYLAYGDLGYVAAGLVLAVHQDAAIWTSPDGNTWTYIPNTDFLFGGGAQGNQAAVSGVAVGNGAMVAVGSWSDPTTPVDSDAAVWRSVDLTSWARVPHDEAVFGDPDLDSQMMSDVVFYPDAGFVAVGSETFRDDDVVNPDDSVAAVWTSPDGLNWSRVTDGTGTLEGTRAQVMQLVAASSDLLVAVGTAGHGASPAFWSSTDGSTWNRTPDPPEGPGYDWFGIQALTAGPSGFVAVGLEATGDVSTPIAYTSSDGQAWARHALSLPGLLTGITHDGESYVAVGRTTDETSRPLISGSADGVTWSEIGERSTTQANTRWLRSVLSTPAGLLGGGTYTEEHTLHGAIWLRP